MGLQSNLVFFGVIVVSTRELNQRSRVCNLGLYFATRPNLLCSKLNMLCTNPNRNNQKKRQTWNLKYKTWLFLKKHIVRKTKIGVKIEGHLATAYRLYFLQPLVIFYNLKASVEFFSCDARGVLEP